MMLVGKGRKNYICIMFLIVKKVYIRISIEGRYRKI